MTELQALERAVDIAGGQSGLARAIGVNQANVWNWLNGKTRRVPAEHALAIERATGIKRHELRPDLWDAPPPDSRDAAA